MTTFELSVEVALANSFLASVDQTLLRRVVGVRRIHEIPGGRRFIDESRPHRCGLVVSGLARVFATRPDGSEVTLRRVGSGAAVGVKAILGRRNQLSVQAITDVEFLDFDAEELVRLAHEYPSLAMAIAAEIDRRLEDTELEIGSQRGTVIQRVAALLLDLSADGEPLVVELSQERLAAMVGASRERVGHELRALSAQRLLRHERGRITLIDALSLQAVAGDPHRHGLRQTAALSADPA